MGGRSFINTWPFCFGVIGLCVAVGIVVHSLRDLPDERIVLVVCPPALLGLTLRNSGLSGGSILSFVITCLNVELYALIGLLFEGVVRTVSRN